MMLSAQSIAAFRLLVTAGRPMTAKMVARELCIEPRNVYRLMRPLLERQMIISGPIVNQVYSARQQALAAKGYARYARQEFDKLFLASYEEAAEIQAAKRAKTAALK
jgi:predicted DNA-binding transcriptional regulator